MGRHPIMRGTGSSFVVSVASGKMIASTGGQARTQVAAAATLAEALTHCLSAFIRRTEKWPRPAIAISQSVRGLSEDPKPRRRWPKERCQRLVHLAQIEPLGIEFAADPFLHCFVLFMFRVG